jgi:hypothetical protein
MLDPVDAMGEPRDYKTPANLSNPLELYNPKLKQLFGFPIFAAKDPVHLVKKFADAKASTANFPPASINPSQNELQFAGYSFPFLIVSTGLCPIPAINITIPSFIDRNQLPPLFDLDRNILWPPCCPPKLGPDRFWKALSGGDRYPNIRFPVSPVQKLLSHHRNDSIRMSGWLVHFHDYGHCDLLDDLWIRTSSFMRLCRSILHDRADRSRSLDIQSAESDMEPGGHFEMGLLRRALGKTIASFVDLNVYKDCSARTTLESANVYGGMKVTVDYMYDRHSTDTCLRNQD